MVKINVYRGNELGEAIDEAISNYDWTEATGTSDKSEQWRIIYQGLIKISGITRPETLFKDIHPDPVQLHLWDGSQYPAVNFDIKKSVGVITQVFTYNHPSEYGTFKLDYTIINGIQSPTPLEAENLFNAWLKEKEAETPEPIPEQVSDPSIESAFDEPEITLPSIYGGQYVPGVEPEITTDQVEPPIEPEPEVTTVDIEPPIEPEVITADLEETPTEERPVKWIPEPFFSFINEVFRR